MTPSSPLYQAYRALNSQHEQIPQSAANRKSPIRMKIRPAPRQQSRSGLRSPLEHPRLTMAPSTGPQNRDDRAHFSRFDRSPFRRVLVQPAVCSVRVVVVDRGPDHSPPLEAQHARYVDSVKVRVFGSSIASRVRRPCDARPERWLDSSQPDFPSSHSRGGRAGPRRRDRWVEARGEVPDPRLPSMVRFLGSTSRSAGSDLCFTEWLSSDRAENPARISRFSRTARTVG